MDCQQPLVKRNMRVLKYRPDSDRERLTARGALVQAVPVGFTLQAECFADNAAMRTNRTIRPQRFLQVFSSGLVVLELRSQTP